MSIFIGGVEVLIFFILKDFECIAHVFVHACRCASVCMCVHASMTACTLQPEVMSGVFFYHLHPIRFCS